MLGAFGIATAAAQQAPGVFVDISACIEIEAAVARLDCFDALARSASAQTVSEASGAADSAYAPRRNETGRGAVARERDATEAEEESADIVSRVSALREIVPGQFEITLENGQVWRQTRSDRYRLQIGNEVRIFRSRLGGSYRLTAPVLRSQTRVERVR